MLEIAAPDYTTRFGSGVEKVDILMATEGNPQATIVADLTDAPQIPDDSFDCAIVTQTLQFVYDVRAALATLQRILAPGGVLLATVPGLTKISPPEDEEWGEWWHYTSRSAQKAGGGGVRRGRGRGAGVRERALRGGVSLRPGRLGSRPEELEAHDRLYEVIVGVRAVKRAPRLRDARFAVPRRAFGRRGSGAAARASADGARACPGGAGA